MRYRLYDIVVRPVSSGACTSRAPNITYPGEGRGGVTCVGLLRTSPVHQATTYSRHMLVVVVVVVAINDQRAWATDGRTADGRMPVIVE